jgi:tRNA G46 methylase TrmB
MSFQSVSATSLRRVFRSPITVGSGARLDLPRRVDLELGCGVGLHSIRYAATHEHRFLIAIERTRAKFALFQGRLTNHPKIGNLLPVHADAQHWITQNLVAHSVERCFILYPNPYPARSQANKRWHVSSFMGVLRDVLADRGTIQIATNIGAHHDESIEFMTKVWSFRLVQARSSAATPWSPRSHFEKKYMLRGEECFDAVFERS